MLILYLTSHKEFLDQMPGERMGRMLGVCPLKNPPGKGLSLKRACPWCQHSRALVPFAGRGPGLLPGAADTSGEGLRHESQPGSHQFGFHFKPQGEFNISEIHGGCSG